MKTLCIAGKNNIAVNILEYALLHLEHVKIVFVPCRNETGINTWQRSAKLYCEQHNVPVLSLDDVYGISDLIFLSTEFDRIVVPEKFKSHNLFNIHFSLLPQYKGVAPSVLPILHGKTETGVTLHRIRDGIDTGEIIDQTVIPITYNLNSLQLYNKLTEEGTRLIICHLHELIEGNYSCYQQDVKGSSYYSRSAIDYSNLSLNVKATADQIHNQIRAFAFRPYQLLTFNGNGLIGSETTSTVSDKKPGTIIAEDDISFTMSTIDYDIVMYKDVLQELFDVIREEDNEKARLLCRYRLIIQERDEHGWTPLTVAVYNNNIEMVKYLVNLGADENAVNNNGTTLLMDAKDAYLNTGDRRVFDYLRHLGLDIYQKDYKDKSLIDYCDKVTLTELGITTENRAGGPHRQVITACEAAKQEKKLNIFSFLTAPCAMAA